VETEHSFLNMLAGAITGGLYSPMTITVQCAGPTALNSGAEVLTVAKGDSPAAAFRQAVARSSESGDAVYVRFAD
jgi:hypothetical protein